MDERVEGRTESADSAKRLGRRATLKLLGLALTGAAAAPAHAAGAESASEPASQAVPQPPAGRRGRAWSLRPLATGTAPRNFNGAQFAALAATVDLILPDTDTPGAKTAGVHWYLDDVIGTDRALGARLRDGLARLDARAKSAHSRPFAELPAAQQEAVLASYDEAAGGSVKVDYAAQPRVTGASPETDAVTPDDRSFFALIKAQTLDAYYKSEMGQIGELEWVGHEFNDEFPGKCTHPDPMVHPRPRWPRTRS